MISHQTHRSCTSMSLWWDNNPNLWISWTASIPTWVSIIWHAACAPSDAKLLEGGVFCSYFQQQPFQEVVLIQSISSDDGIPVYRTTRICPMYFWVDLRIVVILNFPIFHVAKFKSIAQTARNTTPPICLSCNRVISITITADAMPRLAKMVCQVWFIFTTPRSTKYDNIAIVKGVVLHYPITRGYLYFSLRNTVQWPLAFEKKG